MYKARVLISLKKGVLDPQGSTVKSALGSLGYSGIKDVRVGKFLDVTLEAPDSASAEEQVREMARRLLANPVLEDFNLVIEPGPEVSGR